MSSASPIDSESDSNDFDLIEHVWQQQVASFQRGKILTAEHFFAEFPELEQSSDTALDVIFNEFALLHSRQSDLATPQSYYQRFPRYRDQLEKQLTLFMAIDQPAVELGSSQSLKTLADESRLQLPREPGDSVGQVLAGRFEIIRELGRGAMAVVLEAYDRRLKQRVAIKQPHSHVADTLKGRLRLLREARAVAKLHHPGIVPVREVYQDPQHLFLVSPLIESRHLGDLLATSQPTLETMLAWAIQLADALHYAHENGIVHRDVKPSNVLIDQHGQALVTDFGLASDADSQRSLTRAGDLLGTPAFMSPEQASGNSAVDRRSDVYSLGATIYYLLTNQSPFEGSAATIVRRVIDQDPTPVRQLAHHVPADVETIIGKCLAKAPEERYQSARELADDLRRFQAGEPILARPATWLERVFKLARRKPWLAAATVVISLLAVFSTGSIWQLSNVIGQRNRAQQAEQQNAELLANASLDAGRLAKQRGQLASAIEHLETGLALAPQPDPDARLALVECHLSLGNIEEAVEQLKFAMVAIESLPGSDARQHWLANMEYWQAELAAHEAGGFEPVAWRDLKYRDQLDPAKAFFLQALSCDRSDEALGLLRNAIESDPFHHSARRMLLTTAFSLARFDEVIEQARLAQQLYPQDIDFRLFEAISFACQGNLRQAVSIVEQALGKGQPRADWISFCKFLKRVTYDVHPRQGIYKTDLATIADLMTEFVDRFHPLVVERRWRFPPRIGKAFMQLPEVINQSDEFDSRRVLAVNLANLHPEATLLLIAAEASIDRQEDPEQLEQARELFRRAITSDAFIQNSEQIAWLGVYTTAMSLAILHKHEVEYNQTIYVEAAAHLDAQRITSTPYLRTIALTLGQIEQWDVAEPFVDQWVKLSEPGPALVEAQWVKGIQLQNKERWLQLVQLCDQVLESEMQYEPESHNWQGLRASAARQIDKQTNR